MLTTYQYRLYPNQQQKQLLARHFGHTRAVYNWALTFKKRYYRWFGRNVTKRTLQDRLVRRKRRPSYCWLQEVNSQTLLATLGHLEKAYNNFFEGRAQYPRYKSRKAPYQSFQCPQHVVVHQDRGRVDLPKIKGIKAVIHRPFEGTIKTCTVKRTPRGHYYICVLVEDHQPLPNPTPIESDTTIGVDMGLTDFSITSQGKKQANPRCLQQHLKRLKQAQRQLSRKQRGSNNREKQRNRVARLHDKVVCQRKDYHHKMANQLLSDNQAQTLAFEDLHIKGMVRNRRLARHISDVAWSQFIDIVSYKAERQGKQVIRCQRWAPSSKQCSCGYINRSLTLADRHWTCPACQAHHDRDILAAHNIKAFAIADALGQSVCVKSSPMAKGSASLPWREVKAQCLDGSQEAPN